MRGRLLIVLLLSATLGAAQVDSRNTGSAANNAVSPKSKEQILIGARKVALVGTLGHVAQRGVAMNPSATKAQELLEKEIRKWGRFTTIENPREADLVLILFEGNRAASGGGVIRTARLSVVAGGEPPRRGDLPLWDDDASGSIFATSGAPKVIAKFRAYLENLEKSVPAAAPAAPASPTPAAAVSGDVPAPIVRPAALPPPVISPQPEVKTRPSKYIPPFEIINRAKTYTLRGKGASGEQGKFEKAVGIGTYSDLQSAMGFIHQQMTGWGRMEFVQEVQEADLVMVVYQWDTRTYSRQFHGVRTAIQVVEGRDAFQREDPALWVSGTENGSGAELIYHLQFELQAFASAQPLQPTHAANKSYNRGCDWMEAAQKKQGGARSDQLFEAVAELRKSLRDDYGYAPTHERLATALRELGFDANAAYEYQLALLLQPGMQEALRGLAAAMVSIPDYAQAVQVAQDMIRWSPDKASNYVMLGDVEFSRKDYAKAAAAYRDASRMDPKSGEAQEKLGRALYRARRMDEAEVAFRMALQLMPNRESVLQWLGSTLNEERHPEEAASLLRQAVEINPKSASTHYELARALRAMKNYNEALAELKEALALNPTAATYHTEIAHTLANAGRNEEALAKFREIVRNLPDSCSAHLDLGVMLLSQQHVDDAIPELERAIQIDEKHASAYYHLGRAREAKNDLPAAQVAYEKARSLDPENKEFQQAGK